MMLRLPFRESDGAEGKRSLRGFTVLELLISMSILAVILLLLAQALDASLTQWTGSAGRSDLRGELRAASEWMRRDLQSAIVDRPANLPPLPDSVTADARAFFEDRWFLPIEINRRQGSSGEGVTFVNAEPGFDQIAFVTRTPKVLAGDAAIERARLGLDPPDEEMPDGFDACLAGYYVAYTRDSPMASSQRSSLKLFRHFRSGGASFGQGHSRGFVIAFSQQVNDRFDEAEVGGARPYAEPNPAALRQGKFANSELPFLFAQRTASLSSLEPVDANAPWPVDPPLAGSGPDLPSPPGMYPPPTFTWDRWMDPDDVIHDTLFPDEPIAHHVVGFECRAYREVRDETGVPTLMDATLLNAHLGLSGGEWPALVRPDFVDITLTVIPPEIAARLETRADWLGNGSAIARDLIERHRQTLRLQLPVGPAP